MTGDAVNVAARLEQAAGAQEVLLGELTYRLVRDYVDVEEVEPLELKGQAEPVAACRLVGLTDAERHAAPGRAHGRPRARAEGAARARSTSVDRHAVCRLVTVVGEAGVGKSRLVDEFIEPLAGGATVLRGRCLPYGEGITFWPLAEAVRQAAGIEERTPIDEARRQARRARRPDGSTSPRARVCMGSRTSVVRRWRSCLGRP